MSAIQELVEGTPNLRLIAKKWLPWPKLLRLSEHMHLVLQPSYSESFNCVAAEAIRMGVPVVGSEAIDWLPPRFQAKADDVGDIARVAEYLVMSPSRRLGGDRLASAALPGEGRRRRRHRARRRVPGQEPARGRGRALRAPAPHARGSSALARLRRRARGSAPLRRRGGVMPGLTSPGTFASFFGTAVDGDADFSGAGGTLIKPSFFGTVIVGGPKGLEVAGNPIFCRRMVIDSSVLPDGAIHCNGGDGTNGSPGAGAAGGFFGGGGGGGAGAGVSGDPANQGFPGAPGGAPSGLSLGGAGGKGGNGQLGAIGGAGGAPTLLPAPYNRFASFFTALTGLFITPSGLVVPCGGGGGGGGASTGGSAGFRAIGGPGGGGGGIVFVCAGELVLQGANPHFSARGGNGGDAGGGGAGAGGGGGGSGGAILVAAASVSGTLNTNVAGGQGGSGFGGNSGANGPNGGFSLYAL
jgi:hypothetical protein